MGSSMINSYQQKLSTSVRMLWDTLNSTRNACTYLTLSIRSMLAGEPLRRIARKRCLVLLGALFVFSNTTPAIAINTVTDTNNYKLYAHMKLLDAKEYRCLELLWHRESRWDPRADNPKSSAFGIPQMLRLKVLDPYRQIDIGLKYISKRHSTPCKALDYHNKKGHY
jgi:hypothetical protein